METAGKVSSDLDNLKQAMEKYQNEIHNLSSVWQGPSYDNLTNVGESFVSEGEEIISKEMTAFAEACTLYEQYELAKENLRKAEQHYNNATTDHEKNEYSNNISNYKQELERLKNEINSELEIASSGTIDATSFSGNVSTSYGSTNTYSSTETNEKMQNVADTAAQRSGGGYDNMCEEWAEKTWEKATGIDRELQPDAYTAWEKYGVSTDKDNIPKGAMVYGSGWPTEGGNNNPYGHVAIYIGDGKVADQGGVQDLDEWASKQYANCHGHQGYIGWGWQNGVDLTKV